MPGFVRIKTPAGWVVAGRQTIPDPPENPSVISRFTELNNPCQLRAGEDLLDNMPAGVTRVNASTYSSSTDINVVLNAVAAGVNFGCYVNLDLHANYYINDFKVVGTNDWRGYTNGALTTGGQRKIMGLIGKGVDLTSIVVSPTCINNSTGLRNYVLSISKAEGVLQSFALYFSNTSSPIPMFFTGISFDGTLQTPYGVYSTAAQAQFQRNQAVASPLAWSGMTLWRGIPGSRMQFCRFRGFGYALLNAPPFECGPVQTNYSNGFVFYRNEIDGRIAQPYDSARHRASGGLMWNKGIQDTAEDSWMHHTRRSGGATNTNTYRQDERYYYKNFQMHDITGLDEFASNNAGFPGSNVEAVVGIFTYTNFYASISPSAHINCLMPYAGSNGDVLVLPERAIFVVQNFTTDDTEFGGCLRFNCLKQPNASGISPAWTRINTRGIDGSNLFDIRREDGFKLSGVKSTAFNSAIHKKDTHFVVIY